MPTAAFAPVLQNLRKTHGKKILLKQHLIVKTYKNQEDKGNPFTEVRNGMFLALYGDG